MCSLGSLGHTDDNILLTSTYNKHAINTRTTTTTCKLTDTNNNVFTSALQILLTIQVLLRRSRKILRQRPEMIVASIMVVIAVLTASM